MCSSDVDVMNTIAGRSRRADAVGRQAPRRAAEDTVRRRAVVLCNELTDRGRPCCDVARRFHLSRRTMTRWRGQPPKPWCRLPRGRPCKESSCAERQTVLEMLDREGVHLGLPTLRAEFPDMPRCELGELQAAYRRHYRATHRQSMEQLSWHEAGYVWATDHVAPPNPIDGVDRAVLTVRDLASGTQLAWQSVPDQTAPPAAAALKSLIDQHGPPLVLKSDNGSAFKSEAFGEMLARHGIAWLPSPARMPRYNGGCEAGNHSMRTRTDHFAKRAGGWTSTCLEAARRQANELTRPRGHLGPTPSELWSAHAPISLEQRQRFHAAIERYQEQIVAEKKESFNSKNKNHQAQVYRQAVRRALLDCGLLTITRRSITLPLKRKK